MALIFITQRWGLLGHFRQEREQNRPAFLSQRLSAQWLIVASSTGALKRTVGLRPRKLRSAYATDCRSIQVSVRSANSVYDVDAEVSRRVPNPRDRTDTSITVSSPILFATRGPRTLVLPATSRPRQLETVLISSLRKPAPCSAPSAECRFSMQRQVRGVGGGGGRRIATCLRTDVSFAPHPGHPEEISAHPQAA